MSKLIKTGCALAIAAFLAACAPSITNPDATGSDVMPSDIIKDSSADIDADVAGADAPADDTADSTPDGLSDITTDDGGQFDETSDGDPGMDCDACDIGAAPDADTGADSDATPDTPDICPACPRGVCDPETLECLECTKDSHCGAGSYCDAGKCRINLCAPAAMFCVETTLYRCSANGGGFTIIQDCDDKDPCTIGDACQLNKCVPGQALDCADNNACTLDYCAVNGTCDHYGATDIFCDDTNPCTTDDHCVLGECVSGGAADCSDNNPCTLDYCISKSGCIHEPLNGECNDLSNCTLFDRCIEGRCSGTPKDCDDNNPCTTDSCNTNGCRNQPIADCQPCLDDIGCDDGNACTQDICDVNSGICRTEILRTGGCCVYISDCPETPACIKPICNSDHMCTIGSMAQSGCCMPNFHSEDFAAGLPDDYRVDPAIESVGWRIGTVPGGITGITAPAMYFGNPEETSFESGVTASGSLVTGPITLPASAGLAISFATWQDVDPVGGFDTMEISAVADTQTGPHTFAVWKRPSDFPMKLTTTVSTDISALSGRTVRFVFSFDSGDEISNSGRGVYLDDIRIEAACNGAPCAIDADCMSLGVGGFCQGSTCNYLTSWMEVTTFGEAGSGAGYFSSPTDLTSVPGPEGIGQQILVSDSKTHYIQVFDENGTFVRMFGGYGATQGRFLTPKGLAGSESRVFIVDSVNGRIQVMTPAGVFLYAFGTTGSTPGQLDTPRGVAVSPDGNSIYVADTGNHRISVFTRLGVYKFSFGTYGTSPGRFKTPSSVVTDAGGNIWVCDTQNNRLQVFAPNGRLLDVFKPVGAAALNNPSGISRMSDGRIVVADSYNHRLVIFNTDGTVSGTLGSYGTGWSQFNFPVDVDVMPMGYEDRLIVADSGNFRVSVWAVRLW